MACNDKDKTMNKQDIRWKQRFENFEKAYLFFESAVEKESYTPIEIGGLVTQFPREVIKEGFNTQIIEDGHSWLHMLEKRNELSHTYNENVAKNAVDIIKRRYYPAIRQVYQYFKDKKYGH